jgi:hypothetical protein
MKKLVCFVAVVALTVGGCAKTTVTGPGGKKLTLTRPTDQTIRQGETDEVKIMINRDNFRDAVTVKFENLPKGVQVADADKKIGAEDSSATFTLKADDTAEAVDKHKVNVVVEGPDGMKATESFNLTVRPKA